MVGHMDDIGIHHPHYHSIICGLLMKDGVALEHWTGIETDTVQWDLFQDPHHEGGQLNNYVRLNFPMVLSRWQVNGKRLA